MYTWHRNTNLHSCNFLAPKSNPKLFSPLYHASTSERNITPIINE